MNGIYENILYVLFLGLVFQSCTGLKIVQKPIAFDEERTQLSLEYLEQRYGITQTTPTIVPKMVVVHWTVIPTMEKTFDAFDGPRLPGSREKIKGVSQLNVSSQYLIDQDGTIYQLLPDTIMARHVIGLNHCAIGIENVGGGKGQPLTEAQLKSNVKLIKKLAKDHDLEYMIGHYEYKSFIGHPLWMEVDPDYLTDKTDPGEIFMAKLRRDLASLKLKGAAGK